MLALCLFVVTSVTSPPASVTPLEWVSAPDGRLELRYSVACPRVTLRELLRALSSLSGVAIETGAADASGDHEIIVFAKLQTLGTLMDCVRALYSENGGEWRWTQQKQPGGPPAYVLSRSRRARDLGAKLRADIQQEYEDLVENEIAWNSAPDAERSRLERASPDLKPAMQDEKLRNGVGVLSRHTTAEQRTELARPGGSLKIPLRSLSAEELQWVNGIWSATFGERASQVQKPDELDVYTSRDDGYLTPMLIIAVGQAGGNSYAGGMPTWIRWFETLDSSWIPKGEELSDPANAAIAQAVISAKTDSERAEMRPSRRQGDPRDPAHRPPSFRFEDRIRQISDATGLPVMADFRTDNRAEGVITPQDHSGILQRA